MSRVISPSRFLTAGARLEQGPILAIYIDDTIGYGLSPRDDHLMTALDARVAAVLAGSAVPENFPKHVAATTGPMDGLGCALLADRIVPTPKRESWLSSLRPVLCLIAAGFACGHDLQPLLGLWAWAFLLCRPAFSVFHAAYRLGSRLRFMAFCPP